MTTYGYNPYIINHGMTMNTSPGYNPNQQYNPYSGYGIPSIGMGLRPNYYGGFNYMNPYAMQQMRNKQIEEQKKNEEKRRQNAIALSRVANSHLSEEELQEHLKIYDKKDDVQEYEKYMKQKKYEEFKNVKPVEESQSIIYAKQCMIYRENEVSESSKKYTDDSSSMWDYMDNANLILRDIKEEEKKARMKNMGNLYDQNSYNNLLGISNNNNSYFSNMYKATSVDDMEISPPSSISSPEYLERRRKFVETILGGE